MEDTKAARNSRAKEGKQLATANSKYVHLFQKPSASWDNQTEVPHSLSHGTKGEAGARKNTTL